MEIEYRIGDATEPASDNVIIAHICNNMGKWGKGFVVPLGEKYPKAKENYLSRYFGGNAAQNLLGRCDMPMVSEGVWVANMIAQKGVGTDRSVDLNALALCLAIVGECAPLVPNTVVQMPRIGTGLGKAKWEDIEPIIQQELCARGIQVVVFDLPKPTLAITA